MDQELKILQKNSLFSKHSVLMQVLMMFYCNRFGGILIHYSFFTIIII